MFSRLLTTDGMQQQFQKNPIQPARTVSVIVMEPADGLSHQRLHQLVGSSLPQLAYFRSRVMGKPLGIGQPVWAPIDNYDPTSQIHSATICAPGGPREFNDLLAQLSVRPQDCPETLWEAWSIDGLAGGRWALAVKVSPALNDGSAGASMWSRLLRPDPRDGVASSQPSEPSLDMPSFGELVTDTVTELLENYVMGLWLAAQAATDVLQAVRVKLSGRSEPDPMPPAASSMSGPVPDNVFNARLTERRAVAFASIPLADLEAVTYAFGGTVINAFLAACTLSLRAWLIRHDAVPDDPLVIQIPLPLLGADPITLSNPLAAGRIRLPVQLDDPVQVLIDLHTATEGLDNTSLGAAEKAGLKVDLASVASLIPTTLVHAGKRLFIGLGLRQLLTTSFHGNVSYVRGQPAPAYCAGAKVVGMHTVAPLQEGRGLSITLTVRRDVIDLSVCVCPDNVPRVNEIATGIAESVDVLLAAAQEFPRGQGRSVVTQMTSHHASRSQGRRR
jgi:diacylglycerol O-acyltransferase